MKKIDMSSEAITRRLVQTDQLRELCLSLMKAKKIPQQTQSGQIDVKKPVSRKQA